MYKTCNHKCSITSYLDCAPLEVDRAVSRKSRPGPSRTASLWPAAGPFDQQTDQLAAVIDRNIRVYTCIYVHAYVYTYTHTNTCIYIYTYNHHLRYIRIYYATSPDHILSTPGRLYLYVVHLCVYIYSLFVCLCRFVSLRTSTLLL